jgi:hypothetical protein
VIPRGGQGRVRVLPTERRGYSLFSPAPVNALTLSVFNRIRAEEPAASAPDWLETGLCYAALAGAHAQIDSTEVNPNFPTPPQGSLTIPTEGGAVISFMDVAARPRPMEWTMTFDGAGKLLKATHAAAPELREQAVGRKLADADGRLVPQTSPEPAAKVANPAKWKEKAVSQMPASVEGKPVAQTQDLPGKPVPQ